MTRDEALVLLTLAYGHHPALADFNIAAVNRVLDLLIQAEREACAKTIDEMHLYGFDDVREFEIATLQDAAKAIRSRGQA
jgi:hypothetical protein